MNQFEYEVIDLKKIIRLVKRSKFFKLNKGVGINESFLRQIKLDSITLPLKIKFNLKKQNILTLEELLNTETKSLLRIRNIGDKTISKSRKLIIDYLIRINDKISNTPSIKNNNVFDDNTFFVGKYFPLLNGIFLTNQLNFVLINENISQIKLSKNLRDYVRNNKELKVINDLLSINYDNLINEKNIGWKTILKLKTEIIELLNLKEVRFLN